MQVDLIFRIAAVGILVAVLNMLLARSGREEQALLVTIAGMLVVFSMLIGQIGSLFETIRRTFGL
ncbi:MAG: stage III sporulation protein AC [Clostridia bacterium]|nr:stage III sporulation protein AC [Clostridia bacterium]